MVQNGDPLMALMKKLFELLVHEVNCVVQIHPDAESHHGSLLKLGVPFWVSP